MIHIRKEEEIEAIRKSSLLVSKTLAVVASVIKTGMTGLELDTIAETCIRDHGASPAFKGYRGFPNSLCISVNEAVVHGIPSKTIFKEGDLVSVDCGVLLNGYYGDSAFTFVLGKTDSKVAQLCKTTRESLMLGIQQAIANNRVGDISYAIQHHCEEVNPFSCVRELVGHGLGTQLHEEPEIPNYGRRGNGPKLPENCVIAIEPMVNMGKRGVVTAPDEWTIITKDRLVSAHYEHTVCVRIGKAEVLSSFDEIDAEVKNNPEIVQFD